VRNIGDLIVYGPDYQGLFEPFSGDAPCHAQAFALIDRLKLDGKVVFRASA
jgi:hypothetical protein